MKDIGIVRFELQEISYDPNDPLAPSNPPIANVYGCAAAKSNTKKIQLFFVAVRVDGRWRFDTPNPPGFGPVPTCSFRAGPEVRR
jgi:hypothetical protein